MTSGLDVYTARGAGGETRLEKVTRKEKKKS